MNLGLGGACVEVSEAPEVASTVQLSVSSATLWDPLVLNGEVAWNQKRPDEAARMGIRFEHGAEPRLNALVELLGAEGFD